MEIGRGEERWAGNAEPRRSGRGMTTVDQEGATQRRNLACTAQVQASLRQGSRQKSAPQRHESVGNRTAGRWRRINPRAMTDRRELPRGVALQTARGGRSGGSLWYCDRLRSASSGSGPTGRRRCVSCTRQTAHCGTTILSVGTGASMVGGQVHAPSCPDRRTCRSFLTARDNRRRWRARRMSPAVKLPPRPQERPGVDHNEYGGKQALGEV
jgi:hypothetical protein